MLDIKSEIWGRSKLCQYKKFKITLQHEETSVTEHISCVVWYAAWLKDVLEAATNIKVKILIHIQTFIPETN